MNEDPGSFFRPPGKPARLAQVRGRGAPSARPAVRHVGLGRLAPEQSGKPLAVSHGMRLSEVMTTPVETVPAEMPAEVAWERMRLLRIRHLVVVDSDGRIEGIASQGDLGGPHGGGFRHDHTVGSMMDRRFVTASADTTVREAANLMRGRGIDCLAVTRRKRPIGIVTATDLLELIGRGAERPVPVSTRWTLKHRGPRRPVGRPMT